MDYFDPFSAARTLPEGPRGDTPRIGRNHDLSGSGAPLWQDTPLD
jgi:hypothetical protein